MQKFEKETAINHSVGVNVHPASAGSTERSFPINELKGACHENGMDGTAAGAC